jgi:hypothetical protein
MTPATGRPFLKWIGDGCPQFGDLGHSVTAERRNDGGDEGPVSLVGDTGIDPDHQFLQKARLGRPLSKATEDDRGEADRLQPLTLNVTHDQSSPEIGGDDLVEVTAHECLLRRRPVGGGEPVVLDAWRDDGQNRFVRAASGTTWRELRRNGVTHVRPRDRVQRWGTAALFSVGPRIRLQPLPRSSPTLKGKKKVKTRTTVGATIPLTIS